MSGNAPVRLGRISLPGCSRGPANGAAVCAILLVSLAVGIFSLVVGHARGPAWLAFSYDLEYQYLLNALNLLEGAPPGHTRNPGTPVQVFGAALVGLVHALVGAGRVRADVLARPEWFLTVVSSGLMVAHVAVTAVLGWTA